MPKHLDNANFERIPLSISKSEVNDFLAELWNDLTETIGRVSCQHDYGKTESNEIYEYNICWASNGLSFIAELSFFNHTSKGLVYVLLETQDFDTRVHDSENHRKIKDSILRCSKKQFDLAHHEPSGYAAVPVQNDNILSGNYFFEVSGILLVKKDNNNFEMVFPVFNNDPHELRYEAHTIAINLASVLSLLTQNLFVLNENINWKFVTKNAYQKFIINTNFDGEYLPDEGMILSKDRYSREGFKVASQLRNEIIETGDCIVDNKLKIPERTDILINSVNKNYRLQQSCRRFHEGLMLRSQMKYTSTSIYYTAYELVAYVAAIEACLDTESKVTDIICPSCGNKTFKEDRKISEKFKDFVRTNSENNLLLMDVYKELYNDRSRFVHTGINLHTLHSIRPNRPLILRGKNSQNELPSNYYNIHEYTGFILRRYFYSQLYCKLKDIPNVSHED